MSMNAIFVLEPNCQSLLSLLATLAPPGGDFPGTPHWGAKNIFLGTPGFQQIMSDKKENIAEI